MLSHCAFPKSSEKEATFDSSSNSVIVEHGVDALDVFVRIGCAFAKGHNGGLSIPLGSQALRISLENGPLGSSSLLSTGDDV